MSFFKEVAELLGYDEAKLALGYHYIVYDGRAVYVEGIKRIMRIDESETVLAVRGGLLYISGRELKVQEICGGSILVRGAVDAVYTSAALEKKAVEP